MIHESWIIQAAGSSVFGAPLVLLGSSYRAMMWIHSAFEEGSKVMRRYTLMTNISALAHEAGLVAPRTYFRGQMNTGSLIETCNITDYNVKSKIHDMSFTITENLLRLLP